MPTQLQSAKLNLCVKKKIKTKKVHEEYKKNYEENTGHLQFKLTYPVFL